jgi:hypothetical protein
MQRFPKIWRDQFDRVSFFARPAYVGEQSKVRGAQLWARRRGGLDREQTPGYVVRVSSADDAINTFQSRYDDGYLGINHACCQVANFPANSGLEARRGEGYDLKTTELCS